MSGGVVGGVGGGVGGSRTSTFAVSNVTFKFVLHHVVDAVLFCHGQMAAALHPSGGSISSVSTSHGSSTGGVVGSGATGSWSVLGASLRAPDRPHFVDGVRRIHSSLARLRLSMPSQGGESGPVTTDASQTAAQRRNRALLDLVLLHVLLALLRDSPSADAPWDRHSPTALMNPAMHGSSRWHNSVFLN